MKKNVIKFYGRSEETKLIDQFPVPAKTVIPQWFKDIPPVHDGMKGIAAEIRGPGTVKKCMPYLDALTFGYSIVLSQDVAVLNGGKAHEVGFPRPDGLIEPESNFRVKGMPVPEGYNEYPWRVKTDARIVTPPGYSVLITHPLNRFDLPFLSLSGVMDIDDEDFATDPVVTMYMRDGFEGVIEAGTPIAQIIPFKREDWTSQIMPPYTPAEHVARRFAVRKKLVRSYQRQFWHKKSYD